jgi:hypothetical protein
MRNRKESNINIGNRQTTKMKKKGGNNRKYSKQVEESKMSGTSPYLSIITLNVNKWS